MAPCVLPARFGRDCDSEDAKEIPGVDLGACRTGTLLGRYTLHTEQYFVLTLYISQKSTYIRSIVKGFTLIIVFKLNIPNQAK